MSNEVTKAGSALPAHLQEAAKVSIGNVGSDDLIIPRIKLMQNVSPEVEDSGAPMGEFWHTVAGESLGEAFRFVPILVRKGYVLWAPRGDERGILARSSDGVNWDEEFQGKSFDVKLKGMAKPIKYQLGKMVDEAIPPGTPSLIRFGSSIPGDANSRPAANLTYEFLMYLIDDPDMSPVVMINTRSAVRAAKDLLSKINISPSTTTDKSIGACGQGSG